MMKILILSFVILGLIVINHAQTPQKTIHIEFKGNKIFSSDTLLEKLNSCVVKRFDSEDKYAATAFRYCLQTDVLGFLHSQGYLSAKIDEPKVQKNQQSLVVKVKEGMIYRLGNINIQDTKVFTSEQLLEKLNLKTGDIANGQELKQWLFKRLRKLYADKGYILSNFELKPKFKPIIEKVEGIADLDIIVDEGQRFTIDRIEFAGNKQVSDQILRRLLLIKENEVFSQEHFTESIRKLNDSGLFEQIDEDQNVELRTDEESSLLKIYILVRERNPF